jgi:23S rRNA (adenine2503-C2)-methyltransferase
MKQLIKNYNENDLMAWFEKHNERKYRSKQLLNAIYEQQITNFDEITTFPQKLREMMIDNFELNSLTIDDVQRSNDGSIKFLLTTLDDLNIETVFLPNSLNENNIKHNTLCVSTMIGCPLGCKFCATGYLGYKRNLTAAEIIDQYLLVKRYVLQDESIKYKHIPNIVFMGMGEPLLNFEALMQSIEVFVSHKLVFKNNITISTAGIPNKIIELANSEYAPKLALSLHSAFDDIRRQLMPISNKYEIEDLLKSLDYYYHQTHQAITFEYILFANINDRMEDVKRLTRISRRCPSKINLIGFNPISQTTELRPADEDGVSAFSAELHRNDVLSIRRKSQGADILGACGQLAGSKGEWLI